MLNGQELYLGSPLHMEKEETEAPEFIWSQQPDDNRRAHCRSSARGAHALPDVGGSPARKEGPGAFISAAHLSSGVPVPTLHQDNEYSFSL